mmetsp:Transcript_7671/g.12900  ORF Transcript_7671/g.12900 Transcript_7671/m.12900 type:complete len:93 (-) Transcript_7671:54-332(-)
MAKLGFYDIRTFESLSREMENTTFNYNSIYKDAEDKEAKAGEQSKQIKLNLQKKETTSKRKAKQLGKQLTPASLQQAFMRGHTGYLTFAIKF